jgi:hypothetical protein
MKMKKIIKRAVSGKLSVKDDVTLEQLKELEARVFAAIERKTTQRADVTLFEQEKIRLH